MSRHSPVYHVKIKRKYVGSLQRAASLDTTQQMLVVAAKFVLRQKMMYVEGLGVHQGTAPLEQGV